MQLADVPLSDLRVLHIGGYWRGPNDLVRQMLFGLRATAGAVFEIDTDERRDLLDTDGGAYRRGGDRPVWLRWEATRDEIARCDPHIVICNAGGLSFRPAVARDLRNDRCLVGIALSDPDVFATSTGLIAPNFDFFATNAPECIPRYEEIGVPSGPVPLATTPELFERRRPRRSLACEVLVIGTAYPDRVEAVQRVVTEFDAHVYGSGWGSHGVESRGTILGADLTAALSSAKVTLAFSRTGGGALVPKHWLLDCMAAGAVVITERSDEVGRHFAFDEELLGFASMEDLVGTIRHYLAHPEEARAIRRGARRRAAASSWERAWPGFLEAIREGTAGRRGTAKPGSGNVALRRALAAFRAFAEREGHANVQLGHAEDGVPLGHWVAAIRRRHELDCLSAAERKALEGVDSWAWTGAEAAWDEGATRLQAFVERQGHASLAADHVEGGFPLGRWLREQRLSAEAGSLDLPKRTRLEEITGWSWSGGAKR